MTCVGEDKHEQTCTNVLNRLAEGDKALSVGDTLDLEPQYNDLNNLPRVGVECTDKIDGEHFGDITEEVELTEDLKRDIPFSLDGVYVESGTVPAGKYTVKTCSGCGYSEYVTQMPDGLVIIDNNNDNAADKATKDVTEVNIKKASPLIFETVNDAVVYINKASAIDEQTIKLLGNVKETESIEVKGQHAPTLTIQGVSNSILWDIKGISFSTSTNSTDKLILKSVNISGNNGKNEIIQVSRATIILDSGCTVQGVSNSNSAVRLTGGTLEMRDGSVIRNCSSESGGAISASTNGGIINLYGGKIENCNSDRNGGAICVNSKTTLNIKGNPVVVNNTASEKGNNIYLESGKTLNVIGDISGTKTIGIESADKERNQVSGEFGINENTGYLNGKTITAFKNDVDDSLHAEVKDGKIIWAEAIPSNGASGNWDNRDENGNHIPSDWEDFHPDGGENGEKVRISVTGNPDGDYGSLGASKNVSTQGAQVKIENGTDHYLKSFEFKFRFTYSKKVDWIDDYGVVHYKDDDTPLDLSNFSSTLTKDLYWTVEADNINNTITVKSTKKYTDDVLNINHNTAPGIDGQSTFCFSLWYGATLDNSVCLYLDEANVEFVYDKDYYAKLNVNYEGDLSTVKRVEVQNARSMIQGMDVFYPEPNKTVNPLVTPSYALCTNGTNGDDAVVILYGDNDVELSRAYIKQSVLLETVQKDRYGNGVIEVDCPATSKFNFKAVFDRSKIGAIELKNGDGNWLRDDGYQQTQNLTQDEYTWLGLDLGNLPNGLQLIVYGKDQWGNINWNDTTKIQITNNELKTCAGGTFVYTVNSSSETEPSTEATEAIENTEPTETTTEVPEITEPKPPANIIDPQPNAVNIHIKFDSKFKDDVNTIIACEKNNPDWQTYGQPYSIDTNENVIVTDDGFVITNFVPQIDYFYGNFVIALKHDTNLIALTEIIPNFMNSLGETIEVDAKPSTNIIKLNIIYRGEDYSRVHCLKVDGAQSPPNWQGVSVSANSNNIGSIYVTINNNSDITISAYEGDIWGTSIAQRTIPWSDIQKHLGDEMNVIIDPV